MAIMTDPLCYVLEREDAPREVALFFVGPIFYCISRLLYKHRL